MSGTALAYGMTLDEEAAPAHVAHDGTVAPRKKSSRIEVMPLTGAVGLRDEAQELGSRWQSPDEAGQAVLVVVEAVGFQFQRLWHIVFLCVQEATPK